MAVLVSDAVWEAPDGGYWAVLFYNFLAEEPFCVEAAVFVDGRYVVAVLYEVCGCFFSLLVVGGFYADYYY